MRKLRISLIVKAIRYLIVLEKSFNNLKKIQKELHYVTKTPLLDEQIVLLEIKIKQIEQTVSLRAEGIAQSVPNFKFEYVSKITANDLANGYICLNNDHVLLLSEGIIIHKDKLRYNNAAD